MAEDIKEFKPETIPEFEIIEEDIPGLTSDKLDASISIRGNITPLFYTGSIFNSGTSNIKITTGFKPQYVFIESIYGSNNEAEICRSRIIEKDGVLEVMTQYLEGGSEKTLGHGDNTINVVELQDSPVMTARMNSFTSDGFILDNVSFFGGCRLHILAMG